MMLCSPTIKPMDILRLHRLPQNTLREMKALNPNRKNG